MDVSEWKNGRLLRVRCSVITKIPLLGKWTPTYELAPAVIQGVSLEGGDLYAQRTGHHKVRLVPEASEIFSRKGIEGRYLFVRDDGDKVNSMIDRRNNEDVVWKKSGSDAI
jgi:hypothetical protein